MSSGVQLNAGLIGMSGEHVSQGWPWAGSLTQWGSPQLHAQMSLDTHE